jgi:hypothetical protein
LYFGVLQIAEKSSGFFNDFNKTELFHRHDCGQPYTTPASVAGVFRETFAGRRGPVLCSEP